MYFFLFSMEKFLSQQRIIDFHCITLSSSVLSSHIRPNESSGLSIFPDRLFPFYVQSLRWISHKFPASRSTHSQFLIT